ncbi:unnamed protein product, partial [Mesorhabditis spiculigera]
MLLYLVCGFVAFKAVSAQCTACADRAPQGIWGEWTSTGSITYESVGKNLTCGMCATVPQKRTCLTAPDCPCSGPSTQVGATSNEICSFADQTCCPPNKMTVDLKLKRYVCKSPNSSPAPQNVTCCSPAAGLWNPWSVWSGCNGGTCGGCGTRWRTRTCASEPYGCPCTGKAIEVGFCDSICPFPGPTCCSGFIKSIDETLKKAYCKFASFLQIVTVACQGYEQLYVGVEIQDSDAAVLSSSSGATSQLLSASGTVKCGADGSWPAGATGKFSCEASIPYVAPVTTTTTTATPPTCCPPEGIWGAWTTTGSVVLGGPFLNLTCGMCATVPQNRTCLSDAYGCPCSGAFTQNKWISNILCEFPNHACCGDNVKGKDTTLKKYVCKPPVAPEAVKATTCCPSGGLWNPWSAWTACPGFCGMCAIQQRTRTCASKPYGCPCSGLAKEEQKCGGAICPFPGPTCCSGYAKRLDPAKLMYTCQLL